MRLFAEPPIPIDPGAVLLPGFALAQGDALVAAIAAIAAAAPFRQQQTPGGRLMSVAMTSAGPLGWTSGRRGYAYLPHDPDSGRPWPPMPPIFADLASAAADRAGYPGFTPDSCLINRYAAGARMGLHQDRDEADLASGPGAPIISVSLGLPATFLWGGGSRTGGNSRIALSHGDVVAWGGPARLAFHGVAPLAAGHHHLTGAFRYNLTFRHAGDG